MVFKYRNGRFLGGSVVIVAGLLSGLLAGPVVAQSILGTTGELNDGQRILVHGSSFGSRGAAWYYEDFEGATTDFDTTTNPGAFMPSISGEFSHHGDQAMKCQLGDPAGGSETTERNGYAIYWFPEELQAGESFYLSFWERWSWGVDWCGTGGSASVDYQVKNFRITSGDDVLSTPWMGQNNQSDCNDGGTSDHWARSYLTVGNGAENGETTWFSRAFEPEMTYQHNTWMHIEMQVRQSNPAGAANGSIEMWVTRDGQRRRVVNLQNHVTHVPGDRGFSKGTFGNWIDSLGTSTSLYFDNFYVDKSWERIVLGDRSTYDNCVIREVQPFNSWDEQVIDITLVTSGFVDGQEAWLYVVDENGNPSLGHRIVIGESGSGGDDLGPPGASTNVRRTNS